MGEILIGLALIALCLVVYLESGNYTSLTEMHLDPGSFPTLIAALLTFLSLILIIGKVVELRKRKPATKPKKSLKEFYTEYRLVLLTVLLFIVYIFLMQFIGFVVTTILFIIGAGVLIGSRKKKDLIIISSVAVIVTLSTYFFFENVLYIRFPSGIFF
ncbi:tripartite tricarboxylate transporter TctB family protein [Planomicrobium sp. YIM 101495]|uniref:tripartite tricarboxylate transporter TctB family protein n=1 Tax=Planomicrobium sp. YIM 101495 TaxID=2665160 RepID=UPI0012B8CFBA|nr:tripartite tricarboxylate transporter TctB family protein [Planomicrobium sp. YIM 101495]MTD30623.1 hypothetical protein [Planomicrobium sp. YIM 101495]